MDRKQLEAKLLELKSDYIRIQGDLDKMEAAGGQVSPIEQQLERLEGEISAINDQLASK